ncbi:MAG: nitroreductase family protein [Candidatus Odinarchaeia archaeon]
MEFYEVIRKRKSIRKYKSDPVEDEKLLKILEAGRIAPSARNLQNWKFIIVKNKETKLKLMEAAKGQKMVAEAPIIIVACGTDTDYVMSCGQPAYTVDVTIAVEHMILAATAEGLGTCWIGAFYEENVKKILEIPNNIRVVAMFPLGYPAIEPKGPPRKKLEEIIFYEKWGKQARRRE